MKAEFGALHNTAHVHSETHDLKYTGLVTIYQGTA